MPPSRAEILAAVRAFVADSFCDGRHQGLGDDSALVVSGIVDSAGVVHLVEYLERKFGVTIADDEVGLANFNTLAAITDLIARKLGGPERTTPRSRTSR